MARTKAELEQLMADLQAEMDAEDEDLVIETKDGHLVRLKGETKQKYLRKHGLIFDDEEEELEIEETPKAAKKTAAKPVAKKTTARKPVAKVEEDLDDLDDVLEEEPAPKRSFF